MAKLELEAFYPYPVDQVWNALTEPASLEQWLMKNEGFKPVTGQKFNFYAKPVMGWDGKARCEILEVEKPHKLVWSQAGNDEGKGTRLTLLHEGFKGLKGIAIKKFMGEGWKRMLNQRVPLVLQFVLKNGWDKFPKDRRLAESDCHV